MFSVAQEFDQYRSHVCTVAGSSEGSEANDAPKFAMLRGIGPNVHGVAAPILEIAAVSGSQTIARRFQEVASGNIHSNSLYLSIPVYPSLSVSQMILFCFVGLHTH